MNKLKRVFSIGALSFALLFGIQTAYAVDCSDECGSISCPGAGWCGIAYNTEEGSTTYRCSTGQTSTVNNCIDQTPQ